jgi:hypothetical protein
VSCQDAGVRFEARFRSGPAWAIGAVAIGASFVFAWNVEAEPWPPLLLTGAWLAVYLVAAGVTSITRAGRLALVITEDSVEIFPIFRLLRVSPPLVRVPWEAVSSWNVSMWPQVLFEHRTIEFTLKPGAPPELWRARGLMPLVLRFAPAWKEKVVLHLGRLDRTPEETTAAILATFGPANGPS